MFATRSRLLSLAFLSLGGFAPALPGAASDGPASLLVYPQYDTFPGSDTLLTVTNTNDDFTPLPGGLLAGTVDVEFVYISRFQSDGDDIPCLEFNRTARMTPGDTLTVLASFHQPVQARGYAFAFAKSPTTGQSISFDHLLGACTQLDGVAGDTYTVPVFKFRAGPAIPPGAQTDVDADGRHDLDGVEYAQAPDELIFPRFFGQSGAGSGSSLVMVHLSGGNPWTATVDFLTFNDNTEVFSSQLEFRCWTRTPLASISGVFTNAFLVGATNHDPNEPQGFAGPEAGWFRLDGNVATSMRSAIADPAILACLVEGDGTDSASALPFALGLQANGALVPNPGQFPAQPGSGSTVGPAVLGPRAHAQ
jgi:hypothetical protein